MFKIPKINSQERMRTHGTQGTYIYIITLINISCIILLSVSYIFNNNNII